jgi:small subunit ribosomal protein S4
MTKYRGPRIKIIRRLGLLPGLTRKIAKNKRKTPGQHGKLAFVKSKRSALSGDYKERLLEKQKLRFNYGVTEKQLISYYKEAKRKKTSTGATLLKLLESRLDCILYRLGFAPTIPAARQIVNHNHICVNGRIVNIPSFQCNPNDIITIKEHDTSKKLVLTNFKIQEQKRKLIKRRMKQIKLTKSRFHNLLPQHLTIITKNTNILTGKILFLIKRSDVLVRINELKVVEYYSR